MKGWVGVDLDGTLAKYDKWRGEDHIGDPIPTMVERVKTWLAEGQEILIMTARASSTGRTAERQRQNVALIRAWCKKHLGQELGVTSDKDFGMVALYDDRAYRVVGNTGQLVEELMNNVDQENLVQASKLEAEIAKLKAEREELQRRIDNFRDEFLEKALEWRGISFVDEACDKCGGSGVVAYGSTATWHGGIGGQAITNGVCDKCWGSGSRLHKWADLRKLLAALAEKGE